MSYTQSCLTKVLPRPECGFLFDCLPILNCPSENTVFEPGYGVQGGNNLNYF